MRYQRVFTQMWYDEKFKTITEDGKYLFIYMMTNPHSNGIGIYVLPKEYICADISWTLKRLDKPFHELIRKGIILFDETTNLICVKNHLKHNPIENENQAKSAIKIIQSLPKSLIFSNIYEHLTKPFHKPLLELLLKRYANPEEETEEETETEEVVTVSETVTSPEGAPLPKKDFFESLKENPAYSHIDLQNELLKMDQWLLLPKNKGRKKTNAFVLNWLNRIDRPINSGGNGDGPAPPTDPLDHKLWELRRIRKREPKHSEPTKGIH